jgi:hypothetical protein
MKKVLSALVAATLISVTPLVMSDTADAQWGWRGGFHRFGYGYGGWGFRRLGWVVTATVATVDMPDMVATAVTAVTAVTAAVAAAGARRLRLFQSFRSSSSR